MLSHDWPCSCLLIIVKDHQRMERNDEYKWAKPLGKLSRRNTTNHWGTERGFGERSQENRIKI